MCVCGVSAAGGLPDGASVPVPGLGGPPGCPRLQTLLPQAHPPGGPMAARGRGGGGPHHRALPVSQCSVLVFPDALDMKWDVSVAT